MTKDEQIEALQGTIDSMQQTNEALLRRCGELEEVLEYCDSLLSQGKSFVASQEVLKERAMLGKIRQVLAKSKENDDD